MKIIKVYEGFLDKMFEKLPEFKLIMALSDFMNSINPVLECKYKKNSDGLWLNTQDGKRLMYLDINTNNLELTIFPHHENELTSDMLEFFYYVFNTDTIVADIDKKDIPELIKKLTKENYEVFLRGQDANKYNL